jgi:hypothetical protein
MGEAREALWAHRRGLGAHRRRRGGVRRRWRRIGAALLVFGRGGDGDEDAAEDGGETSQEDLIRSGPMTPQRAELEGETGIDFGPDCDSATGRIKLSTVYAPPCVVPFEGDNGGGRRRRVSRATA